VVTQIIFLFKEKYAIFIEYFHFFFFFFYIFQSNKKKLIISTFMIYPKNYFCEPAKTNNYLYIYIDLTLGGSTLDLLCVFEIIL